MFGLQRVAIWKWGSAIVLCLVLLGASIFVVSKLGDTFVPNRSALEATDGLLTTTTALRNSFGKNDTGDTRKVAQQYLSYLQQLHDNCQTLNETLTRAKSIRADQDTIILLGNSSTLCKDLLEVTDDSTKDLLHGSACPIHQAQCETIPDIACDQITDQVLTQP